MDIPSLTQKLVSIPSYVDSNNNENAIGNFIFDYLKTNTALIVEKQSFARGRNNVLAYTSSCKVGDKLCPAIFFVDHLDTVLPKQGWQSDQFKAVISKDTLYGLGAADTKGNLAVLMNVAQQLTNQRVMFLFYGDEEYSFLGMKSFIAKNRQVVLPEHIISVDGENMTITRSCRGLVEVKIVLRGKSGHSARSIMKDNLSILFSDYCINLQRELDLLTEDGLGKPSLNVAYIHLGTLKKHTKRGVVLDDAGNNIPDYLEAVLEFRTNTKSTLSCIRQLMKNSALLPNIMLEIAEVRHDLQAWNGVSADVSCLSNALSDSGQVITFTNPETAGYFDIALLANAFGVRCECIGAIGGNRHGVNEWVNIQSLYQLEKVLMQVVRARS